ncbi:unnamed protein product, partial [Ectocarpus sp. 4 AP-2014]
MGVTKQKEGNAVGAVQCYGRAARDGRAEAQHNLAAIFEKGMPGVLKNDAEAVRLFQLAAEQGLAESSYSLAMHLKFGLGEIANSSWVWIQQADAKCVYNLEQASEQGPAKAMFNLGLMYEKRRGVSSDASEEELLECYEAATEAGVTKAMVNLGVLYLSGRLPGRGARMLQDGIGPRRLTGLWNLALCYERGIGVARDPLAAQALQQQCRDREAGGRRPSVTGDQAGPLALHPRRSSDPSASAIPPPTADNGNDDKANGNESKINARRRSSGWRSSSVPLVTPPPPEGAPAPTATRGDPGASSQNTSQKSAATSASRRSSSSSKRPCKYVPRRDGPLPTDTTGRPSTSSNSQAAEVRAARGTLGRKSHDLPQQGAADDAASPTGARTGG